MLRRKKKVVFYCSHYVDEIWLRPVIFYMARFKIQINFLILGEIPTHISAFYKNLSVKIISVSSSVKLKRYKAWILVSSSTSLCRDDFSKSIKYFCHIPHSLISLHGAYPEDAFDCFNVLLASGQHHIDEFRKIANLRQLGPVQVYKTGYTKLDMLCKNSENFPQENKHILIAPSWGKDNIIERGGLEITNTLLNKGYNVTLRPHCNFILYQNEKLEPYRNIDNPHFFIETLQDSEAIFSSDLLLTDYSGISFEYFCIRPRQIIFADTTKKIFNPNFKMYNQEILEIDGRRRIGHVVQASSSSIVNAISQESSIEHKISPHDIVFNLGVSASVASHQIGDLIKC